MWFCVASLWGRIPILLRITALFLRLVRCYSYLTPLGRFIEVSFNIRCGFLMSGLFLQRCCAVAASAPSSSLLPSFNLHLFLAGGRTMGERWENDGRTMGERARVGRDCCWRVAVNGMKDCLAMYCYTAVYRIISPWWPRVNIDTGFMRFYDGWQKECFGVGVCGWNSFFASRWMRDMLNL